MNLTDNDILELNELCNGLVDETLTDRQTVRLSDLLSTSADARKFYVLVMGLSASLYGYASELQTDEPDNPHAGSRGLFKWKWVASLLALAACLAIVVTLQWPKEPVAIPKTPAAVVPVSDDDFVARLTGLKDCQWVSNTSSVESGGQLRKGQRIEIAKGFAEITFDSGAQVVLQGPASLDVNSAWSATLNRGTLRASLPPEAMSFSISNPTVEVVDLGTEFTMFADASSAATEVLVLKGEVEATPTNAPADQQSIVLREKESRRFDAKNGTSIVNDSEQKFAELSQPVPLDHFVSPTGYAHWSFDETEGTTFKGDASGLPFIPVDAHLISSSKVLGAAHSKGHRNGAVRFDGHSYVQAAFPGISENSPHTVLFWAKVPKDANLSNAYAMVAWGVNNEQLGAHPIQIGWNRFPSDGEVGALRTDYGGGFATGKTSLRDGRWHHIAVVFIPRDDEETPMEVKEYVDGRLEGEGRPSPSGSPIFMHSPQSNTEIAANGTILMGCRFGIKNPVGMARFVGELDELFIANSALEPQEIVRLMNNNQLY